MKKMTIGKRILSGFAIVILVNAVLGLYAVKQLRSIAAISTDTSKQCLSGVICINHIGTEAHENNVLLLRALMTKNEDLWDDLEAKVQTNNAGINELLMSYEKTKTTEAGKAAAVKFRNAAKDYQTQIKTVLSLNREGKTQQAMELKQSQADVFLKVVAAEEDINKQEGDQAVAQVGSLSRRTQISILIGFGVVLGVACLVGGLIVTRTNRTLRHVSQQLKECSGEISLAASEVATSSQTLSEGATTQSASIQETSAALEEMASMTRRNTENSDKANNLARETRSAADRGTQNMSAMSSAMAEIKTSSDDIAKIIKTIDEIAFQTNILALNAAVEAARAGEAGMGFAVVADEVRNLAQRSATAAKETAEKIESAITKTAQGVDITGKVAVALTEIAEKVKEMDALAQEVATASKEQSTGITQISTAMGQLDRVTQRNSASSEESAAAAQSLNGQAQSLKTAVVELMELVQGSEASHGNDNAEPSPTVGRQKGIIQRSPRHRAPAEDFVATN
ncbi:MAG TPA: methyl-accepting chemotaxis protein [Verrucomicrobiae bacterium]